MIISNWIDCRFGKGKVYEVGTLKYKMAQMLLVSFMMLLACQTLMITLSGLGSVKPLLLKDSGASDFAIALVLGSIPQICNVILCPLFSTISDRTRTKWGRRQPFLIFSAPLLSILLVMIGFSDKISAGLIRLIPALEEYSVAFWILAVLIVLFQIVYLFPGTVVYYLIADVIPKECIGRYMAFSAIIGSLCNAAFGIFIFRYAVEYTKPTFIVLGILYTLVYVLLLIFVKEGEYPPVPLRTKNSQNIIVQSIAYVAMFFRQCFQYKIFVFLYLGSGLNSASTICRNTFNVLFARDELHISMASLGKINGWSALLSAVMIYFLGKLMDKTHPLYVYIYSGLFIMAVNVLGYFFIWDTMTYWIIAVPMAIMYAIQNLAKNPLLIYLLPMDKYGQFASADGMINAAAIAIGAALGGWVTQIFGYRVMFIWDFIVTGFATFCLIVVWREWKRFGGSNYVVPKIRD